MIPPGRDVAPLFGSVVSDRAKIAIGVRVMQRSMLGKTLEVISPLNHVEGDICSIAAAERVAGRIEVEPPGIAAPLGKHLKLAGAGMIAPDSLLKLERRGSWP